MSHWWRHRKVKTGLCCIFLISHQDLNHEIRSLFKLITVIKGYNDVGDLILVTKSVCWWHYFDVIISILSPTRWVLNIRHQHRCSRNQIEVVWLKFTWPIRELDQDAFWLVNDKPELFRSGFVWRSNRFIQIIVWWLIYHESPYK